MVGFSQFAQLEVSLTVVFLVDNLGCFMVADGVWKLCEKTIGRRVEGSS